MSSDRRVIRAQERQQQPKGGRLIVTTNQKTIIVTGAPQAIGTAIATVFLNRGYNPAYFLQSRERRSSRHCTPLLKDVPEEFLRTLSR